MPKNILDFICSNSSQILALQQPQNSVNLLSVKEASADEQKVAEAIGVINQQRDLICGLQFASTQHLKIAAALTESCKLAQDGAIDVSDVIEHARRLLKNGSVKTSSIEEEFNQSPGDVIIEGKPEGQQADVLTQTLRELS